MTWQTLAARRSNSPAITVARSRACSSSPRLHSDSASSSEILRMKFEDSISARVASKSWSISLGIQANQSSRTVRERWPARLARVAPKGPPPKACFKKSFLERLVYPPADNRFVEQNPRQSERKKRFQKRNSHTPLRPSIIP